MKLNGFKETFRNFSSSIKPRIGQRITGPVSLITGNFKYLSIPEKKAIQGALDKGNALVLVYDRDSISVPANERAMWIRRQFNFNPALEVRVAYGPPAEKEGGEALYASYIKKQIPKDVTINSVRCNNSYSQYLAKDLKVPFISPNNSETFEKQDELIKNAPDEHKEQIAPIARKRTLNPFRNTIDPLLFEVQCEQEKNTVLRDMMTKNPGHLRSSFFKRTAWNTEELKNINYPVLIGNVSDRRHRNTFSSLKNTQVFDMPVYMPGQGWNIPVELEPYSPVMARITAAEGLANADILDCNAYVTIDCGFVYPDAYARREGLHVDGFLTSANAMRGRDKILWGDNTYIVSDNLYIQTEFYPGPFDLSHVNQNDPKAVLKAFEEQGRNMLYKQFDPYDIVRLNTNNVHAVHLNTTGFILRRCFLKMTFSPRQFNRGGNTVNPHLNYRFTYIPRESGRNTQNFIGVVPAGYREVDLRDIDFTALKLPGWVNTKVLKVSKKPDVRINAVPADEGEILPTEVDGDIVTINIAKKGDMKVTRAAKDSYFLGANFRTLYRPTGNKDEYEPIPQELRAVQVKRNISFVASWGTRQNIPKDGYIVENATGEAWGVHGTSFEATYKLI